MKLTSPPGQTPRARTRVPRCCQPRGRTTAPNYRRRGPADVGALIGAPGAEQERCPNRPASPRPGCPRPRTTAASTRRPVAPSPTAQKAENAAHVLELDGAIGGVRPRAPRNAPARAAAAAPDADLGSEELAKCPVRVRRRLDTSPAQSRRRRGRERPSRAGAAPPPPTGPLCGSRSRQPRSGRPDRLAAVPFAPPVAVPVRVSGPPLPACVASLPRLGRLPLEAAPRSRWLELGLARAQSLGLIGGCRSAATRNRRASKPPAVPRQIPPLVLGTG